MKILSVVMIARTFNLEEVGKLMEEVIIGG